MQHINKWMRVYQGGAKIHVKLLKKSRKISNESFRFTFFSFQSAYFTSKKVPKHEYHFVLCSTY